MCQCSQCLNVRNLGKRRQALCNTSRLGSNRKVRQFNPCEHKDVRLVLKPLLQFLATYMPSSEFLCTRMGLQCSAHKRSLDSAQTRLSVLVREHSHRGDA